MDIAHVPADVLELIIPNGRVSMNVETIWGDGQRTYQRIGLTDTNPHFGGIRWWLVCPRCGRRAGKLYATVGDRNFACRVCRRLVYKSQYWKRRPSWGLTLGLTR